MYRDPRRAATGRAAGVRPARVCRRRARLHVLTRHDHSVSRGRWGVCRLRRGPRAGGERARRPGPARGARLPYAPSSGRAKSPKWRKCRGPHPLAHFTIVFSFSGSHEWCHSTPQHHSLLLRRPMSVCTCKSAVLMVMQLYTSLLESMVRARSILQSWVSPAPRSMCPLSATARAAAEPSPSTVRLRHRPKRTR